MIAKAESIDLPWVSLPDHRHMHSSPQWFRKREGLHRTVLTNHVKDKSSLNITTVEQEGTVYVIIVFKHHHGRKVRNCLCYYLLSTSPR